MAENVEELLGKGMSQQTKQRTGLALFFNPESGDQQRKRNGRDDIKATERMAGSTETQGPHVHAWDGEERYMHGESRARRIVCAPITLMVYLLFVFVFICLQSCSQPSCLMAVNQ